MRRFWGITAAIAAASLAGPASAGAIVQLDRGIGGARLGNTKAEVRAALGQPKRVRNGTNEFGAFTIFVYTGKMRVFFQSGNTVTAVTTAGLGDRTARGVGVGSRERVVRRRVPRVRCETFDGSRICQRGQGLPGERITAFFLENGRVVRVTVGFVID